jgi:MFS family permease
MSDAALSAPQPAPRWRALATACLAHFLHDGYSDLLYLLFPVWQREFALSLMEIGVMKTLYSGAMALFQIPFGQAGERFGERTLLAAGTLLAAIAMMAFGQAGSAFALFALLILAGLGASVQHPVSSSLVSKANEGPHLRTALGTYNFSGDLGKVALPGLTALLMARFGWPSATLLVGIAGVIIAGAIVASLPRPVAHSATGRASTARPSAAMALSGPERRRAFLALSSIGSIDSATRTGFLTFLPFLLSMKGIDATGLGLALSLVFAGGAIGKFVCGVLATRLGVLRTVILTEAATAAAIVALLALPLAACLVLMLPLGIALNGTSSVLYGSVAELVPTERRARAFGVFYTVTIGSGAVAPTIYGMIGDALGVMPTMALIASIVLLVVPLTVALRGVFAGDDAAARG